MEVALASADQLDAIAPLFNQYRVFYGQRSNPEAARQFLQARFQNGDSVVYWAHQEGKGAGFTQLYPSFSSVSMRPIWILNDLFVAEPYRKRGIARLLMDAAETHARETGAVRVALSTQISNLSAQALYESRGYVRDEVFYHYSLGL